MTIVLTFYDEIRAGSAEQVLEQLRSDPNADVEVRINSPGGSVHDGLAIYNALRPRKPVVHIDGVAASIASLVAMAGAHIIAAENALLMIHDPWCGTQGNSAAMRRTADLLDKHRDAMLRAYTRTGIAESALRDLLTAETWMTADEALALGFIDAIAEPLRYAAHAPACFAGYLNTPKELLLMAANARRSIHGADTGTTDPTTPATRQAPASPLEDADEARTLEAFRKGLSSETVTKAARDAVMDALRDRNEQIVSMSAGFMGNDRVREYVFAAMADPQVTAEDAGQRILRLLAQGAGPLNGGAAVSHVVATAGGGRQDDFVQAASDALAIRAGVRIEKPHPGTRDVQGMGLAEIVRACVMRSGRGFGNESHGAMVRAAMSTSDFPAILENTLGKALRTGFETEPATFEAWTRKVMVPDFKPQSRPILGSAPSLLRVPEGGEYTYGSLTDDKSVPYSVGKFGRLVQFTWEALVNDDLGAFLRMTQALGQAAARAEGDAVYTTFSENGGDGPVMQDGVNLFNAAHGNLVSAAADITADALGAARVLLRRQTASGGGVLNLPPRFLLVAPEHEQAAEVLLASAARAISQGADNALVPAWLARLEVVVEARLDGSAFYLLTGPESVDTFERAWIDADNGPVIAEEDGFKDDTKTYKVRHVFGGRWLDWRGAVKVPIS
jgi:ATP-dependent Clp endopeptidase proteolytic subunit ClpP